MVTGTVAASSTRFYTERLADSGRCPRRQFVVSWLDPASLAFLRELLDVVSDERICGVGALDLQFSVANICVGGRVTSVTGREWFTGEYFDALGTCSEMNRPWRERL